MSSSERNLDVNLGRTNVHADLGINRAPQVANVLPVAREVVATNIQTMASEAQTTCLIANEPRSVVMQEQRIAANIPITTEKHITREFIPVVHEEIVTRVPIVTGQAVHTGTAIAGEKYVQQVGAEIIKQQAATRIDVIPEVSTTLGVQQVINLPVNQQAHYEGKACVISEQQLQTGLVAERQFISQQAQPVLAQGFNQTVIQSQPVVAQNQQLGFAQQNMGLGQQNLFNQQQFAQQNILNQGLQQQNDLLAKETVAQELNAAGRLQQQAARDIKKI